MRRHVRPRKRQRKLTSPLPVVRRMNTERNKALEPRGRNAENPSALRTMKSVDGLPNGNENSMMSRSWMICPRRMVSKCDCEHKLTLLMHTMNSKEGPSGYANRGYSQTQKGH